MKRESRLLWAALTLSLGCVAQVDGEDSLGRTEGALHAGDIETLCHDGVDNDGDGWVDEAGRPDLRKAPLLFLAAQRGCESCVARLSGVRGQFLNLGGNHGTHAEQISNSISCGRGGTRVDELQRRERARGRPA